MTHTGKIDGVNDRAGSLGYLACSVRVRVDESIPSTPGSIDSVAYHNDLAPAIGMVGPPLDQINERQVGTAEGTDETGRQSYRLGRLFMLRRKILSNLNRGVSHVPDADCGCFNLATGESAQVVQLRSETGVAGVIDEDEQIQASPVSLGGNPFRYRHCCVTQLNDDVIPIDLGHTSARGRIYGHRHFHGNNSGVFLALEPNRACEHSG